MKYYILNMVLLWKNREGANLKKIKNNNIQVKVVFGIYANKLDFDFISKELNIKPTEIQLAQSIKIKEFQEDGWVYILPYEESNDINIQVKKVLCAFDNKDNIIKMICAKFKANIYISIRVKRKTWKDYPKLSLSKENLCKMAELNVECFDIDLF